MVEGDIREQAVAEEVERLLPAGARCLVIEDSLHEYDTTLASLRAFAKLVPVGGFFVVEDGSVDVEAMRLGPATRRAYRRGGLATQVPTVLSSRFERPRGVRDDVPSAGLPAAGGQRP